jgi:hypothetical protein
MRAPPLSTSSTPAPISPAHARNHLPIGAPLATSVERRRVVISAAPPPSDVIGEKSDDLLILSPSYHNDFKSLGAAEPPRGHEFTMDRESVVAQ